MAIADFYADTSPNKAFTIDTFTRDASVSDCIFDLIDNSIDAARKKLDGERKLKKSRDGLVSNYSGIEINVTISPDVVRVFDNCGGMSPKEIQDHVLRFGQPSNAEYSIGLYGIGLNRAIFKLGKSSEIDTETKSDRSIVEIDMDTYSYDDDKWLIPARAEKRLGETGTDIEITNPEETVKNLISSSGFEEDFIAEAVLRYSNFLRKGLEININGQKIEPYEIAIRKNGPFKTLTKTYKASNGVQVRVTAGQHEHHRFSIEIDYSKSRNSAIGDDYGWSVVCNDRVIVRSNKESKTGWEHHWHTEFNGFVGLVEFIAEDGRLLPWNTSKNDLNKVNIAYQTALHDMKKFTAEWRKFSGTTVKMLRRAKKPLPTPPPKSKPTVPATTKPAPIKKPNLKPVTKPKPVTKAKGYRTLLRHDIDEKNCNDKMLSLVQEAKKLDIYDMPYSGLALIRMLFETSCVCFFIRHNLYQKMLDDMIADVENEKGEPMDAGKKSDFVPDLSTMIQYLITNYDVWKLGKGKMLKKSLDHFKKSKPMLNSAIHHPFTQISFTKAIEIRDEVTPVLRHFIEE